MTQRRRAASSLIIAGSIAAVSAAFSVGTAEATESIPVLDEIGHHYRLSDLANPRGDGTSLLPDKPASRSFSLPAGAKQGDPAWYVVHLDATVQFPAGSTGRWTLTAEINGYAAALIKMNRDGDKTTVSSVSLLGGNRSHETRSGTLTETYANYAQTGGFKRAGTNVLTYELKASPEAKGAPVVKLEESSGVEVTAISPDEVGLGLPKQAIKGAPGEAILIPYLVERRGQRPSAPISISANTHEGLELVSPPTTNLEHVQSTAEAHLVVRAEKPGRYFLNILAKTGYNKPGGIIEVHVQETERQLEFAAGRIAAAGLLLTSVLLGAGSLLRRRSSGKVTL